MEFLALLFLVSESLLLPSLGLAVSGQEAPRAGVHVSIAHTDLPAVAASVLGAESWLRAHVLAHYPSKIITAIVVGQGVICSHDKVPLSFRLSHAVKNLHHSLVRWDLVKDIDITTASTPCARDGGVLKRRLYDKNHSLPSLTYPPPPALTYQPPPPSVPLSFAPNSPLEVVPSVPPAAAPVMVSPAVAVPASSPSVVTVSPPVNMPPAPPAASPPEAASGMAPAAMLPPCLTPPAAAMSPSPWSSEGGNDAGSWCVAKPTVPEDRLQEAMDYACRQDGVDCQEIAAGGSCFYPDSIVAHASYAFNSYWQKMKHVGGSCSFSGTAVLINSDPSYLQCRFMLS